MTDPDDMAEFFDQWPEVPEPFAEYRQSTTACCPRETIPDSCSCLEGCECTCRDCSCGTGCACCGEED
jgi:hypothetical protein